MRFTCLTLCGCWYVVLWANLLCFVVVGVRYCDELSAVFCCVNVSVRNRVWGSTALGCVVVGLWYCEQGSSLLCCVVVGV